MSTNKTQSAIREVRDQLLIDTADGKRLTTVTDNLGFDRPIFGFSNDDEWRALARELALGPRQIELAFRKILDICLGPAYNRCGVISTAVEVGDTTVVLDDASDLVQVGTLVLSPGLAEEETIEYCYIDRAANKVFLEEATANAHVVQVPGVAILATSVAALATTLVLEDSSVLPEVYPFSLSLGKGTASEEVVVVSNNVTATNTLTVSATVNAHEGFKADYVRRELLDATVAGRTFLVFDVNDTDEFPETGWIRIDAGGGAEEVVFYDENALLDNTLYLKTPLVNAHASLESVELLVPGADARVVSVLQTGIGWSVYSTTRDQVKILVPDSLEVLRIIDAAFIHDAVPAVLGSTTLAVATTTTDTVLELVSAADFPDEAGMLTIDGTDRFFYTLRDEAATPNPTLTITAEAGAIYPIGTTVVLFEIPYAGTDLEEGNPRDAGGAVIADTYPGPYVFNPAENSLGSVETTITSLHPPATRVVNDLLVGRETVEGEDLSLWNGLTTPFQSRVGRGTGFEEDLTVVDVTLAANVNNTTATINGAPTAGATSIVVDHNVTPPEEDFPETVGTNTAWFSILIDRGVTNETIFVVDAELDTPGANQTTLTLATPLANTYAGGEDVEMLYDVLTVDATGRQHYGPSLTPTVLGHPIEYLTDTIALTTAAGFSTTGGNIFLNFGNSRTSFRSRLNTIVSPAVYQFDNTAGFPDSDFPYQMVLSQGTEVEEFVNVTANDTGLNQLTFSATPDNIHPTGPAPFGGYGSFVTGEVELIEYQDIDGNDVQLSPAQVISKHTIGESAIVAGSSSIPRTDGHSFPFLIPPDRLMCVEEMIERVRAAGIQVTIIPF